MKRVALLSALLVAVLVCSYAVSTPKPAHAIMCCDNGGYTTSQYWAMGPTCADAQAAFRATARPEANAFCGGSFLVCAVSIPPCYYWYENPANPYVVSGVMTFGCKEQCPIYP
jgi:hypothetical protein